MELLGGKAEVSIDVGVVVGLCDEASWTVVGTVLELGITVAVLGSTVTNRVMDDVTVVVVVHIEVVL